MPTSHTLARYEAMPDRAAPRSTRRKQPLRLRMVLEPVGWTAGAAIDKLTLDRPAAVIGDGWDRPSYERRRSS
jgi:hypothetical protein